MRKIDKKKLLYWFLTLLCIGAGAAIAIVIGVKRDAMYNNLWDEYVASDRDDTLLKAAKVFSFVTNIYVAIPIIFTLTVFYIVDYFFGKRRVVNKYAALFFIVITVYSVIFFTLIYIFRETLADSFFSAIWHLLLILSLFALSIPFRKKKSPDEKKESRLDK